MPFTYRVVGGMLYTGLLYFVFLMRQVLINFIWLIHKAEMGAGIWSNS